MSAPVIPVETARRLLLHAQGLLANPARPAGPAAVRSLIERMGYVQIDTINIVDRAHHHILRTRFDAYRPDRLARLLERDRSLFEHWTHDLCAIPATWFPHWRRRFARIAVRGIPPYLERWLADEPGLVAGILDRVRREGPTASRDFESRTDVRGEWFGAKPEKAALQHLFESGQLLVTRRDGFQRVFDLAERVLPEAHRSPVPDEEADLDWACREALARLVVATPAEVAGFFRAQPLPAVRSWCRDAAARGEIEAVRTGSADDGSATAAFALPDWLRRASRAPAPPDRMRLLSPFDPVLRDRRRTRRLFGFDYRFEGFVPAAKRRHGYYVLPLLDGERLVGRLDPKLHRDRGHLEVLGLWWERGVDRRRARPRLEEALDRLAAQLGAETWSLPRPGRTGGAVKTHPG